MAYPFAAIRDSRTDLKNLYLLSKFINGPKSSIYVLPDTFPSHYKQMFPIINKILYQHKINSFIFCEFQFMREKAGI